MKVPDLADWKIDGDEDERRIGCSVMDMSEIDKAWRYFESDGKWRPNASARSASVGNGGSLERNS